MKFERCQKVSSNISIGSLVYEIADIGCKVLSIDGDTLTIQTTNGLGKISLSRVVKVDPPPSVTGFNIGDRVTLADKYMVRAADIGTVEAFTPLGIQVFWDNNIPLEPDLKQPPIAWRTFRADEIELVEQT
jgi:hypothetical protein